MGVGVDEHKSGTKLSRMFFRTPQVKRLMWYSYRYTNVPFAAACCASFSFTILGLFYINKIK